MAAVTTSTGIFSGLDTSGLIQKMMAVEAQPLQNLNVKKSGYQAELSVFGKLKSSLATLNTAADKLKATSTATMKATSSDASVFTATASTTATAGDYSIQVTRLATAQSVYSSPFASESSEVAVLSVNPTQKLKIQFGSGTAKEITIDSTNNTLSGLRNAIISAGAGVSASIINAKNKDTTANNTIVFNDGSNRTATFTACTFPAYSPAADLKRALVAPSESAEYV